MFGFDAFIASFIPVSFGVDWKELIHILAFDFVYTKLINIWQITKAVEFAFHENWNKSLADGISNDAMKENYLWENMSPKISLH